jgi:hypothetical protein
VRLDAATAIWPPSPAALQELTELALEDLPALLAEVRELRGMEQAS